MDKLKEAIILAGQMVGRSKQDHIVFKCAMGYDFCNPKVHTEKVIRYLKYTHKEAIVTDEKGKETERIIFVIDEKVAKVDIKDNKPSDSNKVK